MIDFLDNKVNKVRTLRGNEGIVINGCQHHKQRRCFRLIMNHSA